MEDEYHHPAEFRYNTNAFLATLKSTAQILNLELQKLGKQSWYKQNKEMFSNDPVLSRFGRGRDIVLHQRPLVQGSRIEAGLFRGFKLKMASTHHVSHDRTSEDILKNTIIPFHTGPGRLVDKEHYEIGMQLGVRRKYFVAELGDEDVYTASLHAYGRMTRFIAKAHEPIELSSEGLTDDEIEASNHVERFSLLLEGDLDLTAYERWEW